jgi:hypothetical protein
MGNFEQAKTIYKEMVQDPQLDGTTAVAAAKYRLETMDSYINTKIAFKSAPPMPVTAAPAIPSQELPYGPRRSLVPNEGASPQPVQVVPEANTSAAK